MTTWTGIDPGKTGGLAILSSTWQAHVDDLPYLGDDVDVRILQEALRDAGVEARDTIAVEYQAPFSMPGRRMGATGAFALGRGYGQLLAAAYLMDLRVLIPRPAVWKGAMGLTKAKPDSIALACQLFPEAAGKLDRKKDHGRAEALLIAEWARRQP